MALPLFPGPQPNALLHTHISCLTPSHHGGTGHLPSLPEGVQNAMKELRDGSLPSPNRSFYSENCHRCSTSSLLVMISVLCCLWSELHARPASRACTESGTTGDVRCHWGSWSIVPAHTGPLYTSQSVHTEAHRPLFHCLVPVTSLLISEQCVLAEMSLFAF